MAETDSADGPISRIGGAFVIAGASGYGCELVVACRSVGREPVCLLDDGSPDPARIAATGAELRGKIDEAGTWASSFLVGIGYPEPRTAVTARLLAMGLDPAPCVIHPSAVLMGADPVPDGTVVFPNATVSRGARLGAHVLVNYNATVGHDTVVGDFTTISPGAQIGGECEVGRGVLIGSGAVILQDVRIGDRAKVGSGAVVTRDVLADELVLGVPARPR
jgi:hypothetical protein